MSKKPISNDDEAQEDQQHPETSGNKSVEERNLGGTNK